MSQPRLKDELLFGRYQVIRQLGAGGMGVVHLARDVRMRREVAIKVNRTDGHHLERFRREFKALSAIQHHGVPVIYDCGDTSAGEAFYTMEIVKGEMLCDVMLRSGPLEPVRALSLAIELGRVLMAVHAAGIIHRDVKPNNIIIEPGDRVRLLDFGVCALTAEYYRQHKLHPVTDAGKRFKSGDLEFVGTAGYTDPQHYNEGRTSPQNDVFSVCVILYECVTGRALWDPEIWRHREIMVEEFAPELAPLAVELQRGTADTADRHRNMEELVRALAIVKSKIEARAVPASPPPVASPPPRLARLAAAAALVCVAATSFALGRFSREPLPSPLAEASTPEVSPAPEAATPGEASTAPPSTAPEASTAPPSTAPEAATPGKASTAPPSTGPEASTPGEASTAPPTAAEVEAAVVPRPKAKHRARSRPAETWDDRMRKAEAHARRCLEAKGVALQPLKVALEPNTAARVRGFTSTAPETECVRAALKSADLQITEGQRMHTFFDDGRPR